MTPVNLLSKLKETFWMLSVLFVMNACSDMPTPRDLSNNALIPRPVSLDAHGSSFALSSNSSIYVHGKNEELLKIGQLLADKINIATGFNISTQETTQTPSSGNLYFRISDEVSDLGEEGYALNISEDLVEVVAYKPAGVFYATQTIRQLLPDAIEFQTSQEGPWEIATGSIKDSPQYSYRGAMLDVARHFFGVEDVKRYIDLIAFYKINTLHLHLSDDQGWRIEIKSWPKLATYGGSTEVGGGEGGYYTQEQYRALVQYAQDRYITIIPEIDMPGHTEAALASYPELNCADRVPGLYTGIEVGFSTLCTDKEIVYQFAEDVIRELAAITPGPFIHIGGDESHATPMEDYIPFVNRVQQIVVKYNKRVLGWDEIAHASLVPNAVVQFWDNEENAKMAIEQNAQVLMSPAKRVYLDMQYDSTSRLGLHWAAYIEVDDAYNWNPSDYKANISEESILGIETPLWSETLENMDDIEYMAFPRLPGVAEIAWTPASLRDWEEYKVRLGKHGSRLRAMDIDYYASDRVPWVK